MTILQLTATRYLEVVPLVACWISKWVGRVRTAGLSLLYNPVGPNYMTVFHNGGMCMPVMIIAVTIIAVTIIAV